MLVYFKPEEGGGQAGEALSLAASRGALRQLQPPWPLERGGATRRCRIATLGAKASSRKMQS